MIGKERDISESGRVKEGERYREKTNCIILKNNC